MRYFYGLWQHQTGSMSTLNGKALDKLHRFESRIDRDVWVDTYRHASALSRSEALRLAPRLYGQKLDQLETWDSEYDDGPSRCELGRGGE